MDSKVSFSDSNIMIITFFLFKKEKRRCRNGKHHRGKEGGRIETRKPGERASGYGRRKTESRSRLSRCWSLSAGESCRHGEAAGKADK